MAKVGDYVLQYSTGNIGRVERFNDLSQIYFVVDPESNLAPVWIDKHELDHQWRVMRHEEIELWKLLND